MFEFLKIYLFIFYLYGHFACMYVCVLCVCTVYMRCLQRPEDDGRIPGTGGKDGY